MKKYFVKESEEELVFGDVISVVLEKEFEDGCVTCEKKLTFTEGLVEDLINLGVVEEREVEDEDDNDLIDFDSPCESLQDLIEDFEVLEERVDNMDTMLKEIYKIITKDIDDAPKQKKSKSVK